MGLFERFLTVWMGPAILAGVALAVGVLTRLRWLQAGGAQQVAHGVAALEPRSVAELIGRSNFFELAVAFANRTRHWFPA